MWAYKFQYGHRIESTPVGVVLIFFFRRYVLHRFPKVGSGERIFYEKLGVLGTKILEISILRSEILAKNKAEMQNFSKN